MPKSENPGTIAENSLRGRGGIICSINTHLKAKEKFSHRRRKK